MEGSSPLGDVSDTAALLKRRRAIEWKHFPQAVEEMERYYNTVEKYPALCGPVCIWCAR
jgi:hypothetical protein